MRHRPKVSRHPDGSVTAGKLQISSRAALRITLVQGAVMLLVLALCGPVLKLPIWGVAIAMLFVGFISAVLIGVVLALRQRRDRPV